MTRNQIIERPNRNWLETGIAFAEFHLFKQYMSQLSNFRVEPCYVEVDNYGNIAEYDNMRIYRITQLVLDNKENPTDKLASVYGAIHSINATIMLIIKSTRKEIEFYIGVKIHDSEISPSTAGMILEGALKSNFPGSVLSPSLKKSEIQPFMDEIMNQKQQNVVSSVAINPALRDNDKDNFIQGLEKLMDAFSGKEYTAYFIAQPLDKMRVEINKRGYEDLYSALSPFAETTLSYGTTESKTVTENISRSFSESLNNGVSKSNGSSQSSGTTGGTTTGDSYTGFFGGNYSSGESSGWNQQRGSNWSESITEGITNTAQTQDGKSVAKAVGTSDNITMKHTDKTVSKLLECIDEHLKKISSFESYGMWACSAYFVSNDMQTSVAAANTFRALVLGDETRTEAFVNTWDKSNMFTKDLLRYISLGSHPRIRLPEVNEYMAQIIQPTSFVSGKELPIFLGFPRFSLKGLIVNKMASFGRAVSVLTVVEDNADSEDNDDDDFGIVDEFESTPTKQKKTKRLIQFGHIMHKGVMDKRNPVNLDVDEFNKHCFITGSTGSGKSTATYNLLESMIEHNIPFLVVEPKKGEYKQIFGKLKDINIFWTSSDTYSFLRINPFSFPSGIHVLEHMDRLIEIFNACWPLHNAMPAILKSATERSYISRGWDLLNSRHFDLGKPKFPTFDDLLVELKKVIEESEYSTQAKGDYKGALMTRVSSLTNGIMGQVFTSGVEISDEVLFDQYTIVDLSRVGASETISLIMGIIVMKLNEYRISEATGVDQGLCHLTVIEEAHNLLRRVSTEQSGDSANVAGKSVEMISNSIAEMRTYGEGFLIIDQSPTAVDISAIKNTNTKIVMRLPERTDIEAVGSSFSLEPEQIDEISRLPAGVAIVSQSGWVEPVMTKTAYVDTSKRKYNNNERPPKNESRHVVYPFAKLVLDISAKGQPNDLAVKELLENKKVSPALSKELFNIYKHYISQSQPNGKDARRNVRASFMINIIGCKGLVDIYPFKIDKEWSDEKIKKAYKKWQDNIILPALDQYAEFTDGKEKMDVLEQLITVKAHVDNGSDYQKLIDVMKK